MSVELFQFKGVDNCSSKEAMQAKTVEFSKNARSGNNYNIKKQFAEPIKKPMQATLN
jgi:hypothetical protein